jgi:hypothetical protein
MLDSYSLEVHARHRHETDLERSARNRLLQAARAGAPRRDARRAAASWLGRQLVALGHRLQAVETAADTGAPATPVPGTLVA